MDEVIVYASDKEQGFALVRILGDKMTAEKIMKLGESIKDIDSDNFGLKQLEGFIKKNLKKLDSSINLRSHLC